MTKFIDETAAADYTKEKWYTSKWFISSFNEGWEIVYSNDGIIEAVPVFANEDNGTLFDLGFAKELVADHNRKIES